MYRNKIGSNWNGWQYINLSNGVQFVFSGAQKILIVILYEIREGRQAFLNM